MAHRGTLMKTEIISIEDYADLHADMLGISRSKGTHFASIIGTHPTEGLMTFVMLDHSAYGVLTRHGPAPYVRREGEMTPRERDEIEGAAILARRQPPVCALRNSFL